MMTVISPDKVALVLGGKEALGKEVVSEWELEQIVVQGLPSKVVTLVVDRIYPQQTEKYYELVPRTTLNRKLQGNLPLPVEYSEKLERLARIYAFALEVWNSETDAREFMTKPHPMLEGRSPFEASLTELGARQVEQILGRLLFGSAA